MTDEIKDTLAHALGFILGGTIVFIIIAILTGVIQ